MKKLGLLTVFLAGLLLIYITGSFPTWGDPNSPASSHLSPYYIQHTMPDTSVPNIVTSVLADYRGYDTMFETTVVFTAGLACFFILGSFRHREQDICYFRHIRTGVVLCIKNPEKRPEKSTTFEQIDSDWIPYDYIVSRASRLLIPFIQLFALYVIAHGHHSPGGGFQGGVILAAALLLLGLSHNMRTLVSRISHRTLGIATAVGVLIYAGVGALCLLFGGNFLDYGVLHSILGVDPIQARSLGILFVEIGVATTVMSTMIIIYNNIASVGKYDEGL